MEGADGGGGVGECEGRERDGCVKLETEVLSVLSVEGDGGRREGRERAKEVHALCMSRAKCE